MTKKEFEKLTLTEKVDYLLNSKYSLLDLEGSSFISFIKEDTSIKIIFCNLDETEEGALLDIYFEKDRLKIEYLENNEELVVYPRIVRLMKTMDMFDDDEFEGVDLEKVKAELCRRWNAYEDQTSGQWYNENIDGIIYNFKADMINGSPSIITLRVIQ